MNKLNALIMVHNILDESEMPQSNQAFVSLKEFMKEWLFDQAVNGQLDQISIGQLLIDANESRRSVVLADPTPKQVTIHHPEPEMTEEQILDSIQDKPKAPFTTQPRPPRITQTERDAIAIQSGPPTKPVRIESREDLETYDTDLEAELEESESEAEDMPECLGKPYAADPEPINIQTFQIALQGLKDRLGVETDNHIAKELGFPTPASLGRLMTTKNPGPKEIATTKYACYLAEVVGEQIIAN